MSALAGPAHGLGTSYVISLDASNCRTGDTIEKRQVQAANKDDVLKALGRGAEELRRGLGESLASIEKYDARIQDATTASLDALKSYSLGIDTRRRQGDAAALPFFRKAIEQDPDFAVAHARLSTVYSNLGERQQARAHIMKAYALKDRVSEPERLYITAWYFNRVEGSVQKTIDTYQIWIQTYPKDFVPHSNLAVAYGGRREYERAAEEYRAAIALAPDEPLPYTSLAGIYMAQGNFDAARRTIGDAIKRGMDSTSLRAQLYTLAFLAHDDQDMARQVEASRKFGDAFRMLAAQMNVAMYQGQLARAQELVGQFASESKAKTGLKGAAAGTWSNLAQVAAVFGDTAAARRSVRTSLDLERNLSTLLNSAFALAVSDDPAGAQKLIDEAVKLPDASNEDAQRGAAVCRALVRLRQGETHAIDAIPAPKDDNDTSGVFILGVAHLAQGHAESAAQHFRKIVDSREPSTSPLRPLASLHYGRALAKLGKIDESRKAYDAFFDAWKNADANLPVLVAAKGEYARLGT